MPQETKSIKFLGLELNVEFYWEAGEPEVRTYSNGDPGYPGSPAEFEIRKVMHDETDITEYLSDKAFEEIDKEINSYDGDI